MSDDTPAYEMIEDDASLAAYMEKLSRCPVVAVDTESNSLYHYIERVSLIQVTGREADGTCHHAIIDPFADLDVSPLGPIMADPEVVTIFHGADFDVVSLKRDYGFSFAGVYDTMIAARAAGVERFGLADLVRGYFGVELNKKYQKHDWAARPIIQEALDYAHLDTRYLPEIMDRLRGEVAAKGRCDMVDEECELVADRTWAPRAPEGELFLLIKGANKLQPDALKVLRELFAWREGVARKRDVPSFKVVGNDLLLAIAQAAPDDAQGLEALGGKRHRMMRRYGPRILDAIAEGKVSEQPIPKLSVRGNSGGRGPRFTKEDDALFKFLRDWRNRQAKEEGVEPAVVVNNTVLQEVAALRPEAPERVAQAPSIRRWQLKRYAGPLVEEVARFEANGAGA